MLIRGLLTCAVLALAAMPAHSAAEKTDKTSEELNEENRQKVEAEIKKATPITEWISSENALIKRLEQPNQKQFFYFRNKHSIIRAVETVQRDVGNAVTKCAKHNEDLATDINARYQDWQNAITPILKDARGFLKTELKEQEAFHMSDYDHIMTLNDKAYKFSESKIEKTPVTTAEACRGLMASMDRTEETLINILQDVLLPEEVIKSRVERAKKAEEAAAE